MPSPRPPAKPALLGALGTLALAGVAGCGGSSSSSSTAASAAAPAAFPSPAGKTFAQLRAGLPRAGVLAPSVSLLTTGTNRIGFALFDPSMKMIEGVPVALYVADASGTHLQGPFRAVSESLAVKPAYESQTVAQDPAAAHFVYVADVPIPGGQADHRRPGEDRRQAGHDDRHGVQRPGAGRPAARRRPEGDRRAHADDRRAWGGRR